jgi:hypothetical protein
MLWRVIEDHPPSMFVAFACVMPVIVMFPISIILAFIAGMAVMKVGAWLDHYGVV